MAEEYGLDFISQYRTISNKLKKRFLRKTNAAEPSDQFASLAVQCEKADMPEYAALSWLGVANCESSLGHVKEEANALCSAGRQFVSAADSTVVGCAHLTQAANWCFDEAVKKKRDNPELPSTKDSLLPPPQSLLFLSPSANNPHHRLSLLESLANNKLVSGDNEGALDIFTEIVSTVNKITSNPIGVYRDILLRCEIFRVLLVLLVGPTAQRLPTTLANLIDKYTWIGEPDASTRRLVGEELFFLLQSLVMGYQSQDRDAVSSLELPLSSHISSSQHQLLVNIIASFK